MGALIDTQIASLQSIGQRQGLKKTETKPFTGDGIHAAGSISNKSDAVVVYAIETPGDGDRAARDIDGRAGLKIAGKLRELAMQRGEAEFRITRDQDNANFFPGDGSDVSLNAVCPVNFRAIGPGFDAIVAAQRIAAFAAGGRAQARPAT